MTTNDNDTAPLDECNYEIVGNGRTIRVYSYTGQVSPSGQRHTRTLFDLRNDDVSLKQLRSDVNTLLLAWNDYLACRTEGGAK